MDLRYVTVFHIISVGFANLDTLFREKIKIAFLGMRFGV